MPVNRIRPVMFTWSDEGTMVPLARFKGMCDRQYIVGEEYALAPYESISTRDRGHFHAAVASAWKNLPEDIAPRFPSSEHLRKWALVQVGCCTENHIICDSPEEAKTTAALVRTFDEYAIITVSKKIVNIWRAKSTANANGMQAKEYNEAKWQVIDLLAGMINVPRAKLSKEAERISGRPERVNRARFN